MKNIIFKLGENNTTKFSKQNINKLETGILIAKQILKNSFFKKLILNFKWKDKEDILYERFHLSNGLSNQQIYDHLISGTHSVKLSDKPYEYIYIQPFLNRKDLLNYNIIKKPVIWFNVNSLESKSYTELHVASCLIHEWCKILGFNTDMYTQGIHYKQYSVPFAIAKFASFIGMEWAHKFPISFGHLHILSKNKAFYYHPSTDMFNLQATTGAYGTSFQILNEAIDMLYREWFSLRKDENTTDQVSNRIIIIQKSIEEIEIVQKNLLNTSLDGAEKTFKSSPILLSQ